MNPVNKETEDVTPVIPTQATDSQSRDGVEAEERYEEEGENRDSSMPAGSYTVFAAHAHDYFTER